MMIEQKLKCLTCPYYLGKIKPATDPCVPCTLNKRHTHPFRDSDVIIHKHKRCVHCGFNKEEDGYCVRCGELYSKYDDK